MARKKQYFKVLLPGRTPVHSYAREKYPHWPKVGTWTEPVHLNIVVCSNGYHLFERRHLETMIRVWAFSSTEDRIIYLAEGAGDSVRAYNKVAFRTARLVRRLVRVKAASWRGEYSNRNRGYALAARGIAARIRAMLAGVK